MLGCPIDREEKYIELCNIIKSMDQSYRARKIPENAERNSKESIRDKQKDTIKEIGQDIELTAYVVNTGVEVSIEYAKGKLYQAYYSLNYSIVDMTDKIIGIIPEYIKDFKDIDTTTVSGRLVIPKEHEIDIQKLGYVNINHAIVHFAEAYEVSKIRQYIRFIAEGIRCSNGMALNTLWDSLNWLKDLGFEVPQKIKAKGINSLNIDKVVDKTLNYFNNLQQTEQIAYSCENVQFNQNSLYLLENKDISWREKIQQSVEQVNTSQIVRNITWKSVDGRYLATIEVDKVRDKKGNTYSSVQDIQFRTMDRMEIHIGQAVELLIEYSSGKGNLKLNTVQT